MDKSKINKNLLWDYDLNGRYDEEEFNKLYISRVLNCGTKDDLRKVGMPAIKKYLPRLNLSREIRKFWEWYFNHAYTH